MSEVIFPNSIWAATAPPRATAPMLAADMATDTVIIGGGFNGLSAALELARAGQQVVLLEGQAIGWGASGRNNGQVIPTMTAAEPDAIAARYGAAGERFARLIGNICQHPRLATQKQIALIGPGRWGTGTASLGIPVSFGEINTASVFCELDSMHEGLVPDLSLGTHFFNEMVEMNILYVAYFGAREGNRFDPDFLLEEPNQLGALLPEQGAWEAAIRVVDANALSSGKRLFLHADSPGQRAVLYHL